MTEYDGIHLIARERSRQKTQEGWTDEHDDQHQQGELARAAAAYAWDAGTRKFAQIPDPPPGLLFPKEWWTEWWKPSDDPIRNLVKAGALIAAEIDRLQRLQQKPKPRKCIAELSRCYRAKPGTRYDQTAKKGKLK